MSVGALESGWEGRRIEGRRAATLRTHRGSLAAQKGCRVRTLKVALSYAEVLTLGRQGSKIRKVHRQKVDHVLDKKLLSLDRPGFRSC